MRDMMYNSLSWPPGLRLAVFFYLPAFGVLLLVWLVAEVPLYVEYRVTTYRRLRGEEPLPEVVGDVAAMVALARPAARLAAMILLGLMVTVAFLSIAAYSANQDAGFLHSCQNVIDGWWRAVAHRANVPGYQ